MTPELPQLTLIIAVYNNAGWLRFILAALQRQSFKSFEVIIADDGSGPEVTEVIEQFTSAAFPTIKHIRHEDVGWRKNVVLNKAVRASSSDYLVFIDGDCVPHKLFLEDHWFERGNRVVLCGRRAEMSERWTRQLTLERIANGSFESIGISEWYDGLRNHAHRIEDGLRFRSQFLRRILHGQHRGLLGSNFSLHRDDLLAINGFDEEYDGPGCGEDSDIEYRLRIAGVNVKPLRHRAIQFHLYHPRTTPSPRSLERFNVVRERKEFWCERGLQHSMYFTQDNHAS